MPEIVRFLRASRLDLRYVGETRVRIARSVGLKNS